MQHFCYQDGQLCAEQVPLAEIAGRYGTPCYVYSRAAIEQQWLAYDNAFAAYAHLICYAVKANGNLAVLNLLSRLGSGFDIVSAGELERVLAAGGSAEKVVFSGVGKRHDEIARALKAGIKCFNCESAAELARLNEIAAELGVTAPVSLRVNPDVDANTHPYISTGLKENKFGIPHGEALAVYEQAQAMAHIEITGIDCHIGSQITAMDPYEDAISRLMELVGALRGRGITLRHVDIGGGLGIRYRDETPISPAAFAQRVCNIITAGSGDGSIEILMEPGRSIVGNAGVLLTRVEYLKGNDEKNFAIVDTGMNDLLRPALYDGWQEILPVNERSGAKAQCYDVVGPICETADFIGHGRELAIQEGDLLAVCSAGAYGFSMSSNYNARPRAAEIMVDGERVHEVRRRERIEEMMAGETLLPE